MVYLYTGTPGSGKSLHMAQDIKDTLRFGGLVVANFDFNIGRCKVKKGGKFVMLDNNALLYPSVLYPLLEEYYGKRILVCIDECQIIFNARQWNTAGRTEWIKFFTVHRHVGGERCKICLVTQFDKFIDKQIRAIVELETAHKNIKYCGTAGLIISLFFGGALFHWRTNWYGKKETLDGAFLLGRKSLYRLYDTHASFSD